jgi:SpoVK/Ycf46/Vps4 family AAA+-type ATPase
VSDFLGAGGELVEARAKAIFQMLEAQSGCVILFDEIDAFLLDRDSEHYRRQGTLFQFLTPGMLTKFNDLRSKKQSIFIIATNFANRIDPAIKRPGRIDKQYLLLPPDFLKRKQIIQQLAGDTKLSPTNLTTMAQASLYLGYKEIEGAMSGVSGEKSDQAIIKNLKEAPRSSSDRNYLARLGQEAFPEKEFFAVANMAVEAGQLKELNGNIRSHKKLWKATIAKHRRHNDWHSRSTSCQIV